MDLHFVNDFKNYFMDFDVISWGRPAIRQDVIVIIVWFQALRLAIQEISFPLLLEPLSQLARVQLVAYMDDKPFDLQVAYNDWKNLLP